MYVCMSNRAFRNQKPEIKNEKILQLYNKTQLLYQNQQQNNSITAHLFELEAYCKQHKKYSEEKKYK